MKLPDPSGQASIPSIENQKLLEENGFIFRMNKNKAAILDEQKEDEKKFEKETDKSPFKKP